MLGERMCNTIQCVLLPQVHYHSTGVCLLTRTNDVKLLNLCVFTVINKLYVIISAGVYQPYFIFPVNLYVIGYFRHAVIEQRKNQNY